MYIWKDLLGCQCLHVILEITLQRTCAVNPDRRYPLPSVWQHLYVSSRKLTVSQTVAELFDMNFTILPTLSLVSDLVHDDLIQTVPEIPDGNDPRRIIHNLFLCPWFDISLLVDTVKKAENQCWKSWSEIVFFLKSTVRPCESVIRPSSSTCRSTLNHPGEPSRSHQNKHCTVFFRWPLSAVHFHSPIRHITEALDRAGHGIFLHVLLISTTDHILLIVQSNWQPKSWQALFYQRSWSNRNEPGWLCGPWFRLWNPKDRICYKTNTLILSTTRCAALLRPTAWLYTSVSLVTGILVHLEILRTIIICDSPLICTTPGFCHSP